MIYLAKPFHLSNEIQAIPMNDHVSSLEGKIATISGWGMTEIGYLRKLSQTDMIIEKDALDHANNHMLRMPNAQGTGACYGDSGGKTLSYIYKIHLYLYCANDSEENVFEMCTYLPVAQDSFKHG